MYQKLHLRSKRERQRERKRDRDRDTERDLRHRKYKKSTELSKSIWSLTEEGIITTIKSRMARNVYSKTRSNCCKLCLKEK